MRWPGAEGDQWQQQPSCRCQRHKPSSCVCSPVACHSTIRQHAFAHTCAHRVRHVSDKQVACPTPTPKPKNADTLAQCLMPACCVGPTTETTNHRRPQVTRANKDPNTNVFCRFWYSWSGDGPPPHTATQRYSQPSFRPTNPRPVLSRRVRSVIPNHVVHTHTASTAAACPCGQSEPGSCPYSCRGCCCCCTSCCCSCIIVSGPQGSCCWCGCWCW